MNDIQKNYNQLLIRYDEILKENESLKALLRSHGIYYAGDMLEQIRDNPYSCLSVPAINLSLDDRVRLFQSYFKGREDARRWFSKATEKSDYQPVCKNEWRQNICDKKRQKCADCPNTVWLSWGSENQNKHKLSKYKDKSRKFYPYQCRLPPFDDIDFFLDDSFNGSLAILQLHKIPVLRQIW